MGPRVGSPAHHQPQHPAPPPSSSVLATAVSSTQQQHQQDPPVDPPPLFDESNENSLIYPRLSLDSIDSFLPALTDLETLHVMM